MDHELLEEMMQKAWAVHEHVDRFSTEGRLLLAICFALAWLRLEPRLVKLHK